MTEDRLKTDIEGTRRTTIDLQEKEKQDVMDTKEKNAKQRKMKCMQGYLDRLRRCRESIKKKPTSMDRESVEDVSSIQRAQDFSSMDQPIY